MAERIPTEQEVLGYFKSLSNWGRWGADDQRGTLNFISADKTKRAVQMVKEGSTVSCARTIHYSPAPDIPSAPLHYMVESGEGWASGDKISTTSSAPNASEFVGMVFHGNSMTHMDSLAHFFWEGTLYNGGPAHLISTSLGATVQSIEVMKDSVVSRGVLVDVPMIRDIPWVDRGEGVMPEDIEAAEQRCGFRVEEGDVLLIRTGELKHREVEGPADPSIAGSAACQAACLPLFHGRRIAVLARIHRRTALGTALEEASGCSSESGIMVLEQKPARKQGAPNRCCHRTNPTVSASSLTTIAWWPMLACSCRPP